MAYNSIKGGEYNMNERIKELRKSLGLTQEKFAERLKMKRNTIANYEIGRNDPIPAVVTLICKEFNVNEDWLRNGTGEMFIEVPEEAEFEAAASFIKFPVLDHRLHGKHIVILTQFSSSSLKFCLFLMTINLPSMPVQKIRYLLDKNFLFIP